MKLYRATVEVELLFAGTEPPAPDEIREAAILEAGNSSFYAAEISDPKQITHPGQIPKCWKGCIVYGDCDAKLTAEDVLDTEPEPGVPC